MARGTHPTHAPASRSAVSLAAVFFLFTFCLAASMPFSAEGGEHWTSYRGPTDQGHSDATGLPIAWSEEQNVTWKTPLPGKAWSSPVIWGDRIWLTTAPDSGTQLTVLSVDKQTGKIVFRKQVRLVIGPQYCHPFNSYASPSPVVEEGRVYVSFGSPYNGCLDSATGEVLWERTDLVCNHFRGAGSSPYLFENLYILHLDGADRQYIIALDKNSGETVWQTDRSLDFEDLDPTTGQPLREGDYRKAFSTPLVTQVDGKPVLLSLGSQAFYAYEPHTGKELWRTESLGCHSGACRPVLGHGLVFTITGIRGEIWAIRPNGRGVVTDSHVAWKYGKTVPNRPSLLLVGELLFTVDDNGVAACINALTGKEVWRERLGGNFSASPIFADGKIYFCDQDGKSTVIEASQTYRVLAENQLDEGFMASPAVSQNGLFLRTKTHLYRIEEK